MKGRTTDTTDQLWAKALKNGKGGSQKTAIIKYLYNCFALTGISISRPDTCSEHSLIIKKLIFFRSRKIFFFAYFSQYCKS